MPPAAAPTHEGHQPGAAPGADAAEETRAALRCDARFGEVLSFLRTFSLTLRWTPVGADALESALVQPQRWGGLLAELHAKLLRRSHELGAPFTDDGGDIWVSRLARRLAGTPALWPAGATAPPLKRGHAYTALTVTQRLALLHALCVARLDSCAALAESARLTIEAGAASALRDVPIGTDAAGVRYFHLAAAGEDCRVYRRVL
jgi:hypothetical protein